MYCISYLSSNILFHTPKMNIQLVQMLQQGAEGRVFGHLCEGIDILGKAFAAVAVFAIRTGDVGVGVIYISREEHSCMHLAPVGPHLLAVLAAGIEVGYFVGSKDIMHILG